MMSSNNTILLCGRDVHYSVRFSRKAKHISLSISLNKGLVVIIPYRFYGSTIIVENLLQSKARWIIRKIDRVAQRRTTLAAQRFVSGAKFQFNGQELTLAISHVDRQPARVRLDGQTLDIRLANNEDEAEVRRLVVAWYKHAAKRLIPDRVRDLNRPAGFKFSSITIRDQRSRWGSCSRRRALSFNWRLLLLPPKVMDYLIFHELAHLQEMNHSEKFWLLLNKLSPDYRESEFWLKQNGIHLFW